MNINHIIVIAALIGFAVSSGLYLQAFATDKHRGWLTRLAQIIFLIATCLMTYAATAAKLQNIWSMASGFLFVSLLAWMTIGLQLFSQFKLAGTFVAPLITLISLVHLFTIPSHSSETYAKPDLLLSWHIYTSVIGQAFGILAAAIALLHIILQRAVKRKQLDRILKSGLSLNPLEKGLFSCIWLGFGFLTIGLILGAIYTQFSGSDEIELSSKLMWALLVWLSYFVIILCRNVFRVATKKIVLMTFGSFGIMALGFFGLVDL